MAIPGNSKTFHLACMDGDTAAVQGKLINSLFLEIYCNFIPRVIHRRVLRNGVQRWLDAGLYVDKRDAAERTGLHQAAWSGRAEVASLLLGAHADANARDKEQRTPLHLCSQTGHSAVIKGLLAFAADVNAADRKLETPLSKAARAGMTEAVGVLLAANANIEIRDVDGHLAGDTFSSKVSAETRETILAMRRGRRQELAAAKKDEEALRLVQRVQTGPGRKGRGKDSECACCSLS